jgi:hypothetical protein
MLLTLAVVAGVLGSYDASAGRDTPTTTRLPAHAPACQPQGAHTIAADRQARAFSRGGVVYACLVRTSKLYRLGRVDTCIGTDRAGPVVLARELVAYGLERCGIDTGFTQVIVLRLSDGKRLRAEAALTGPLGPESYVTVTALVLKADGAAAWIASGQSLGTHGRLREVNRAERAGRALLDSGLAIDPGSLRLHGSTLTWKRGRTTRSASLA